MELGVVGFFDFFFFKQKTAYEMRISDWSSDVCSSDLEGLLCPPSPGGYVAVKEAVLPFNRFPDADSVLGPEMRSTGEVMGIDTTFGLAFAKSQLAAGDRLPTGGCVFMSLADRDKVVGTEAARQFVAAGFTIAEIGRAHVLTPVT